MSLPDRRPYTQFVFWIAAIGFFIIAMAQVALLAWRAALCTAPARAVAKEEELEFTKKIISPGDGEMQRNQAIEFLRILGACGIVWFHSGAPGHEIAYSGLSLFIIITLYFETGPNWDRHRSMLNRSKRLLWPWVFWFAVYAVGKIVIGEPPIPTGNGLLAGILDGSMPHLWYLPFMFAVLVALDRLKPWMTQARLLRICAVLFIVAMVTAIQWSPATVAEGAPYAQWAEAGPAVLLGIIFGTKEEGTGLAFIVLLTLVYATLLGHIGTPHAIAAAAFLVALMLGTTAGASVITPIAGATFGIYLVHPLFLHFLKPMRDVSLIGYAVATFVASLAVVLAYRFSIKAVKHMTMPAPAR